jgi:Fe-S cluster biogenesis protein NfuA
MTENHSAPAVVDSGRMRSPLEQLVDDVLTPLIAADGGHIEVVSAGPAKVVVRLSGACTGCPGIHYTRTHVVVPLVRKTLGNDVEVIVENNAPGPRASA